MRYHLNLLRLFWRNTLLLELEYRLNFFFVALTSVGNAVAGLFGLYLFFRTGYRFQGWSWEQALLVMGTLCLLVGFRDSILAPNLSRIVSLVQRGTLDFVLLKPVDSQFMVSLRAFSPSGLPDLLLGLGILAYAGVKLDVPLSAWLLALPMVLTSWLILYALWFMVAATSIWFVRVYNATEVLNGLLEAGRYPASAYPVAFRYFFTFVVPVTFMTTVPAEVVLGRGGWTLPLQTLAVAAVLLLISRGFWKWALRYYTSASS